MGVGQSYFQSKTLYRLGGIPCGWDKLREWKEENKDYKKPNGKVIDYTKKILEYKIDIVDKSMKRGF